MATFDVAGTWHGRLIDIRGYEGEISLRLTREGDGVRGVAEAAIGATHTSELHRIALEGDLDDGVLVLKGEVGGGAGVGFGIEARVFELTGGGLGLRGTYEVVARAFSPLRAGVIAASKGVEAPSTEVKVGQRGVTR